LYLAKKDSNDSREGRVIPSDPLDDEQFSSSSDCGLLYSFQG
jgi:hypothetical protein